MIAHSRLPPAFSLTLAPFSLTSRVRPHRVFYSNRPLLFFSLQSSRRICFVASLGRFVLLLLLEDVRDFTERSVLLSFIFTLFPDVYFRLKNVPPLPPLPF